MDPTLLGQPIPVPTAQKPTGLISRRTLLMIIGAVAILLIGMLLLLGTKDTSGPLMQQMSLREKVTMDLLQDGKKNITNDDLSKLNSELSLLMVGHNSNLAAAFKTNKMPKVDMKKIKNPETSKDILEKLNTAKLNGRYDSAYKTALKLQLESLNQLGKELHAKTRSASLKTALSQQYTDVAKYLQQLEALPAY